jgi:CheY-like chemotaxis protein
MSQGSEDARRSRRVLVVDDDPDSLEWLTMLLEGAGHRVKTARDGRSGIEVAVSFLPEVVVCDIRMPDVNGLQVARAIKANAALAGCYIIAVTGMQLGNTIRTFGVDEHFVKPVDPKSLLAAVNRASDRTGRDS